MPTENLTPKSINKYGDEAATTDKAIELRDTKIAGLICRIHPAGRKVFVLVTKSKAEGRRWKRLGVFPQMTIEMAREACLKILGAETEKKVFPDRSVGKQTLRTFAERDREQINLRTHRKSTAERAVEDAERILENDWSDLLDLPMRDISRKQIEKIQSQLLRDGDAPATVNRKSTVLRGILSRAIKSGDLLIHPMDGLEALRVVTDEKPRMLTDAERGRLYGLIDAWAVNYDADKVYHPTEFNLKPEHGTAIYILLNTGARMGELRGLRTVDTEKRMVTIRATTSKVSKERNVPISTILAERLATHKTWSAPTRREWDTIMRHAHITDFTPKDCRSDFCSRLANSGVPMHIVSKLAGHSTIVITAKYYTHIVEGDTRDAVDRF